MEKNATKTSRMSTTELHDLELKPSHMEKVKGGIDTVPLPERPVYGIGTWPTPEQPRLRMVLRSY